MRALLALLLAGGLACLALLAHLGLSRQDGSALFLAALLVWPLVALALLLLTAFLLRPLWTALAPALGHTAVTRLLAGGAVACLFADTVHTFIAALAAIFFELCVHVPRSIAGAWSGSLAQSACTSLAPGCLQPLLHTVINAGADALAHFGDRISTVDVAALAAAMACWVLLGQALSAAAVAQSHPDRRSPWSALLPILTDRASPWRANLTLFVIIAVGATLSASALIALPLSVEVAALSERDVEQAQGGIDAFFNEINDLPEHLPLDDKAKQAVHTLRTEYAASLADNKEAADALEMVFAQLERDSDVVDVEARRFWSGTREAALRQFDYLKNSAHDLIQRQNLADTSLRSKSGYVLDIKSWVEHAAREVRQHALTCREMVEVNHNDYLRSAHEVVEEARNRHGQLAAETMQISQFLPKRDAVAFCSGGYTPKTPNPISAPSLGPFSFATWLIRLNSLSLTLLTGMLGFGLLGASISSVIRDQNSRTDNEPLVKDLSQLLMRGMSATIVVYLAVKGSLAIFTGTSAPEPNAYVLLLTCFVASVFSDDVWVAAKKWLQGRLAGKEGFGAGEAASTDDTAPSDPGQNKAD
jgi:hypothetical protein